MAPIPVTLTEAQFTIHIEPHLSKAKRGYVSKQPLYRIFNYVLYVLHTGCQWEEAPIARDADDQPEMSWQVPRYHFYKWSKDGSFERLFHAGILEIRYQLNTSIFNMDGSHSAAKRGEDVAYQGRKKAKTSNILTITDGNGYILATSQIIAGNHHDSYNIIHQLKTLLTELRIRIGPIAGAYFNADSAFDTKAVRKLLWNRRLKPNIALNTRHRKKAKRGRKRHFNPDIYKQRFTSERTFAWIDTFRRLLIRFERKSIYFLGFHFIAYTLINLRNLLKKV